MVISCFEYVSNNANSISGNKIAYFREKFRIQHDFSNLNKAIKMIEQASVLSGVMIMIYVSNRHYLVIQFNSLYSIRKLSKDCKFKAVTAEQYREELIRDAFINGLFSPAIRQRLLESDTLSLQIAYDKANSLDLAQKNADTYSMYSAHTAATSSIPQPSALSDDSESSSLAAAYPRRSKCYFCGGSYHNRRVCPARDVCCNNCNKKGHFRKVCRSNSNAGTTATIYEDPNAIAAIHGFPTYNCTTGITAAFPQSLSHAAVPLSIHGHTLTALIDSCSSDSFMSENIANQTENQTLNS